MADIDPSALQRSDLNSFLFADIGEEANGMTLSVFSTLARSDVDPWQEAERLAKLPRPEATRELARTIVAMPATAWSLADAAAIAERLVVLLPPRGSHLRIFPSTQSVLSTQPVPSAQSAGASMAVPRQEPRPSGRHDASPRPKPKRPETNRQWAMLLALLSIVFIGLALNVARQRGAASDSDVALHAAPADLPSAAAPGADHVAGRAKSRV